MSNHLVGNISGLRRAPRRIGTALALFAPLALLATGCDPVAESGDDALGQVEAELGVYVPGGSLLSCDVAETALSPWGQLAIARTPALEVEIRCGEDTQTYCVSPFSAGSGRTRVNSPIGSCESQPVLVSVSASLGGQPESAKISVQAKALTSNKLGDQEQAAYCKSLPCEHPTGGEEAAETGRAFEVTATYNKRALTAVFHLDSFAALPLLSKKGNESCETPGSFTLGEWNPEPLEIPLHIVWVDRFSTRWKDQNGQPIVGPHSWDEVADAADSHRRGALQYFFGGTAESAPYAFPQLDARLNEALPLSDAAFVFSSMTEIDATQDIDSPSSFSWAGCSQLPDEIRANVEYLTEVGGHPVAHQSRAINVYVVDAIEPASGPVPPPYTLEYKGLAGLAYSPGNCCDEGKPLIIISRNSSASSSLEEQLDALTRLVAHEIGHLAGLSHLTPSGSGAQVDIGSDVELVHRHNEALPLDMPHFVSTDSSQLATDFQLLPPLRNLMAGWDSSTGVTVDKEQAECLERSLRSGKGYLRQILEDNFGVIYNDGDVICTTDPQPDRSGPQSDDGCDELVAFINPNLSAVSTPFNNQTLTTALSTYDHVWNRTAGNFAMRSIAISKSRAGGSVTRSMYPGLSDTASSAIALVAAGTNYNQYANGMPLTRDEDILGILVAELDSSGNPPEAPRGISWTGLQAEWDNIDPLQCQPYWYRPPATPATAGWWSLYSLFLGATGFDGHVPLTDNIWGCPVNRPGGAYRVDSNWYLVWFYVPHGQGI